VQSVPLPIWFFLDLSGFLKASSRVTRRSRGRARGPRGSTPSRQPPQQPELTIEQWAGILPLDRPAPPVSEIERAADLACTAVRHGEKSPRIAPAAAAALGEVVHDTAGGA